MLGALGRGEVGALWDGGLYGEATGKGVGGVDLRLDWLNGGVGFRGFKPAGGDWSYIWSRGWREENDGRLAGEFGSWRGG